MLTGFRVLDLTDDKGFLAGKILGDLGADVIKVERPGGDPARNIAPFYHNIADPEKSLFWFAYNSNKRGITLHIETADGREIFKRLARSADCVIESFPAGYLRRLGLGYRQLEKENPAIIMVSISPFGQKGPYRNYKATDIVAQSMGGFLYLCGDPDRPPVGISLPHAYFAAASDAAAGAVMAYYHREVNGGEGQWVDVSLQQSAAMATFSSVPWWELNQVVPKRRGPFRVIGMWGGLLARQTWHCKDGFVIFILTAGAFGVKTNQGVTNWLAEEGMAPAWMTEMNWANLDGLKVDQEFAAKYEDIVGKFFLTHTATELYEGALKRDIMLYPVANSRELAENAQLKARGFWQLVNHPELGDSFSYPGAWAKMSDAQVHIRRRAPLIGEHNQEIYEGEMGMSKEELSILKQVGAI